MPQAPCAEILPDHTPGWETIPLDSKMALRARLLRLNVRGTGAFERAEATLHKAVPGTAHADLNAPVGARGR